MSPQCAGTSVCTAGFCQPPAPTVIWITDFEGIAWDQFGQGTLSNGVQVWDIGGPQLRTKMLSGSNSLQALGWYGGNTPASPSSATMTLPYVLDSAKNVELKFDGFSAVGVDVNILVGRAGCSPVTRTISSSGWTNHVVSLPTCGTASKIVFQVGVVYQYSNCCQALKFDNVSVAYL